MKRNRKITNETKLTTPSKSDKINFRVVIFKLFSMKPFVRVNTVEYSTNLDKFVKEQVHIISHLDRTVSVCSQLEERCFRKGLSLSLSDDKAIMDAISLVLKDIIALKYSGELIS